MVVGANHELACQHIPRLIILMVDVERSDEPRRLGIAARVRPLRDDKRRGGGAERGPRQLAGK
jgi:hypothetical protein